MELDLFILQMNRYKIEINFLSNIDSTTFTLISCRVFCWCTVATLAQCVPVGLVLIKLWAASPKNVPSDICDLPIVNGTFACVQYEKIFLFYAFWIAQPPQMPHANRDLLVCANAQVDLSLGWSHMFEGMVCNDAAHRYSFLFFWTEDQQNF